MGEHAKDISFEGKPAIVCDADKLSQVAILQELGKSGVPVVATATSGGALGLASRFVSRKFVWDTPSHDPRYVDLMIERLPRGVVFYSNDANTENLSAQRGRLLDAGFRILIASPEALGKVLNKDVLASTTAACGISVPRSAPVTGREELERGAREIGYPLIIKSTNLAGGVYRLVRREEDLLPLYDDMSREIRSEAWKHRNARLFLQEWIDTRNARLWNFNALAKGGEILSWSMGVRHRTNRRPDGTIGSTLLFGETEFDEEILEANRRILRDIRYDGFLETEWSKAVGDDREMYLYDFNPRPSGNIRWVFRSGVPMALQYYRLCLGEADRFQGRMNAGTRYYKIAYRDNDFLLSLDDPSRTAGESLSVLVENLRAIPASRRHAVDVLDPEDLGPTFRALRPLPWLFAKGIGKLVRNLFRK